MEFSTGIDEGQLQTTKYLANIYFGKIVFRTGAVKTFGFGQVWFV